MRVVYLSKKRPVKEMPKDKKGRIDASSFVTLSAMPVQEDWTWH